MIVRKTASIAVLLLLLFGSSLVQAAEQPAPIDARLAAELGAPAVANEFVVKFQPGTSAATRAQVARRFGGTIIGRNAALDLSTLRISAIKESGEQRLREQTLAGLRSSGQVVYAEPNYLYNITWTPNDPAYSQQWAWNVIDAPAGWDITRGSSSTIIAVIDTGIQLNHPDLDAKIVAGYDFVQGDTVADDLNGHGTHVAGTSAAESNNGANGAGVCPNCRLMPVRVLNRLGSGSLANIASGITYAADNGAKVINMSLGGSSGSTALQNAVNYAWNKGVFLACAAGNNGNTAAAYPAYYSNCFAVAATTSSDAKASFSTYGTWVEVAAPGDGIYSTWKGSSSNTISGTSMASPHVAGLAGLLASQGLTNAQIRDRICATAEDISGTGSSWTCGRINLLNAVAP